MLKSFAASVYIWSNRAFRVLHGGAQALFEGFWMGLLPESAYDVISEKSYGLGEQYTGKAWLDNGFHFWEDLAVRKHFPPGGRVLVGSAGGGRELVALEREGFQAVGFECSREMVAAGQRALAERGMTATLSWAPPSVAPAMGETFDAAIVGWNGYCYISPRERRILFLRDLRAQMKPGAPMLVSFAMRTPRARTLAWTPRVANAVRICTFRAPVFEGGDSFGGRPKMHFTRRQVEREMADAGFNVMAFYSWGGYGALIAKSQGVLSASQTM
jgi:hypothetical protein